MARQGATGIRERGPAGGVGGGFWLHGKAEKDLPSQEEEEYCISDLIISHTQAMSQKCLRHLHYSTQIKRNKKEYNYFFNYIFTKF